MDPHHILIEDPDGSCTLILDNLAGGDSGQYMCFAASAAGNASTLGKILVQGEQGLAGERGFCSRLRAVSATVWAEASSCGHLMWPQGRESGKVLLGEDSVALPSLCYGFPVRVLLCPPSPLSIRFSPHSYHRVSWPVPPRFVSNVRAVPFVEEEDAQFTCTIEGAPYPQIRWGLWAGVGNEGGWVLGKSWRAGWAWAAAGS